MGRRNLRTFYGDGDLVDFRVGPGPQVLLTIDMNSSRGPNAELRTVWCGRVENLDQVEAFLSQLRQPTGPTLFREPIRRLDLLPETAGAGRKRLALSLYRGEVVIECRDIAEQ